MSEELATQRQIRKFYAVLRNEGIEPEGYVKKLMEERRRQGLNGIPKNEMSRLIDQFETYPNHKSTIEAFVEETVGNKEDKEGVVVLSEEDKAHLNEIDAVFRECVARATDLVSAKLAVTEPPQATIILEIAKLYFAEVRKGKGKGRAEGE